jgi:amidase
VTVAFRVEEATIESIHTAMRAGELTCRQLVAAYLGRIAAYDEVGPRLNAVVCVNPNALERADELDDELVRRGTTAGPLHGIPVLVKDCIETREMPTTFGSVAIGPYRPKRDAAVVRRLEAAGAVILAKTTLADFTASWFSYSSVSGDTRNPYALDRDWGGSRAGSGAGVAANLGAVGIGTDCGGSIRLPASFNNLVGMRGTTGLVSRAGTSMLVAVQDTIGPLTRTVADAAVVFAALVGYDPEDPHTAAATGYDHGAGAEPAQLAEARIGVLHTALAAEGAEAAAVAEVFESARAAMRDAGATLVDVAIPELPAWLEATSLYRARMRADIDTFLAARPTLPVRSLREIHERGLYDRRLDLIGIAAEGPRDPGSDAEVLRRHVAREQFTRMLVNVFTDDRLHALAFPSVNALAPRRDGPAPATLTFPTNTLIASQAGMPAISLPAGFTREGFPVGLELLGKPYDEATLFGLGLDFERTTACRRPPLSAPGLAASVA